jgi:hypothetical protein
VCGRGLAYAVEHFKVVDLGDLLRAAHARANKMCDKHCGNDDDQPRRNTHAADDTDI